MTAVVDDVLHGVRVLVVEDEALIVEELRERLSRHGATVVATADTARDAVDRAIQAEPDLILMDVRLRGEDDGVRAAELIRERIDVPIVYLTAHSDKETLSRAKSTAPIGYVLKPFQESDLLVTIEMALHRHRLERQLRDSERRYAETLASIADGVIATDRYGFITFMNPVAEALTGWRFADAGGTPVNRVYRLVEDSPARKPVEIVRRAFDSGKPVRLGPAARVCLVTRDESLVPIDDCAAPIMDEHGRIRGVVVAFRDIRDRRLAEDALQRAQHDLQEAAKMEAIGRLAGGIAHDFNNLLTIINGSADAVLSMPGVPDDARQAVQDIANAGLRAAAITREFLTFARKQPRQPRLVAINRAVSDLKRLLSRLLPANIQLVCQLQPGPLFTLIDPTQLEQVILNLVVNARDAMLPGGGTITVATALETGVEGGRATPGAFAVLSVSDTGEGMDEVVKAHLFEPYFTTKDVGKGSGLGLASVHGIVAQSGGFLRVDSTPGSGSRFLVYLPLSDTPTTRAESQSAVEGRRHIPAAHTILVVDDTPGMAALAAGIVRQEGYQVLEATDPNQALRMHAAHKGSIDLVVTDLRMAGMDGEALREALRERDPQIRAVFMSASAVTPLDPTDRFLAKPFAPSALVALVNELLD